MVVSFVSALSVGLGLVFPGWILWEALRGRSGGLKVSLLLLAYLVMCSIAVWLFFLHLVNFAQFA